MLSSKFVYEFTALTLLFLFTYLAGARWGILASTTVEVMLIRTLQHVIPIALTVLVMLFVIKAMGLMDPFSADRGLLFAIDLAVWWGVCRVYLKRTAPTIRSRGRV